MATRVPNMINLITWPLRSEIWLFVPFSLLSLIAFLLEFDIDQYEYTESEEGVFQNISSMSDSSLAEILPTILEFKLVFFFAILVLSGALFGMTKVLQQIFFGKLTETERNKLSEFFFRFVLLRIVILSGIINVTRFVGVYSWIAWFSVLGLLHACSIIATSRCSQLTVSSNIGKLEWFRLTGSVIFLTATSILLFKSGVIGSLILSDSQALDKLQSVTPQGIISAFRTTTLGVLRAKFTGKKDLIYDYHGLAAFIAAEFLLLFLSIIHVFGKLAIEIYDRRMVSIGHSWMGHASFAYYVDLLYILSSRLIEIAHYTHLLLWSRLFSVASLIVFLHIRFAFASLVHHIHRHIKYIRLMNYIKNNFEAFSISGMEFKGATTKDLPAEDDTNPKVRDDTQTDKPATNMCAICWEEMLVWRRLPCKHDFHEICLRSWLEQHPTCPTCRHELVIQSSATLSEVNRNAVNGQVGGLFRLLLRAMTRQPETVASAQQQPGQMIGRPPTQGVDTRNSSYFARLLWNRAFGSHDSVGNSTNTSSSSSVSSNSSQQEPLEDRAGSALSNETRGNQARGVPSSNRRLFNDSYLPWINAELSEMLRQILSTDQTTSPEGVVPIQDEAVDDNSSLPTNHELEYLPQRLQAPALEISRMLPQFPMSLIVADLLQTSIPDRTVENLLARPPPSSSLTSTQPGSDNRPSESPVDAPIAEQPNPTGSAEDTNDDDDDNNTGGSRSNVFRRLLGRAGRRFFATRSE